MAVWKNNYQAGVQYKLDREKGGKDGETKMKGGQDLEEGERNIIKVQQLKINTQYESDDTPKITSQNVACIILLQSAKLMYKT